MPNIAHCGQKPVRVLVVGFDVFGGYPNNPSKDLVLEINKKEKAFRGIVLDGIVLPVVYHEAWSLLKEKINGFHPDFVLAFGYHPQTDRIRIETTSRNYDGGFADNSGLRHRGPIVADGPPAIKSELPIHKIESALLKNGIPAAISGDAGDYLCNHLFYHLLAKDGIDLEFKSGFIHLPNWKTDGKTGLMRTLSVILDTIRENTMKFAVMEFEPIKSDIDSNLERIDRIMEDTSDQNIGFYVFPEMALTGYVFDSKEELVTKNPRISNGEVDSSLGKMAVKHNATIGIGLPETNHGLFYNSYKIYSPDSDSVFTYRKNHRYGSDFNWAAGGGGKYPIFESKFGKIGVLICHDVVYDESFITYIKNNVKFLIIGTNWIGDSKIYDYLMDKSRHFKTIFISDRKGMERDIIFHGNTFVMDANGISEPKPIAGKYRGILYNAIND